MTRRHAKRTIRSIIEFSKTLKRNNMGGYVNRQPNDVRAAGTAGDRPFADQVRTVCVREQRDEPLHRPGRFAVFELLAKLAVGEVDFLLLVDVGEMDVLEAKPEEPVLSHLFWGVQINGFFERVTSGYLT